MTENQLKYRADIDGLRAVAVILVLLFHANLGFSGGYIGVDIFFVISGYLITSIILKDLSQKKFTLTQFWERRIRRIFPALAVVITATVIAGWFVLLPADYRALGGSVVANSLFVANIRFWQMNDYFAAAADLNPLLHTWSLAVEEQFYLVIPLLMQFVFIVRGTRWIAAIFAVLAIVSVAASIVLLDRYPVATFFLLPTRAWELLTGSLLALFASRLAIQRSTSRELISAVGFAAIVLSGLLYTPHTKFPGLAAAVPVIGTMMLIWGGMSHSAATGALPLVNRMLGTKPVVFVGLISYSLYLWHWPIFAYARYLTFDPLSAGIRILILVASFFLAILSWRFVESPFRKGGRGASSRRVVLVGIAGYATMALVGFALWQYAGFRQRIPPPANALLNSGGKVNERYHRNMSLKDIPDGLTKLGDSEAGEPSLLVWGDSHAIAILPAIDTAFSEMNKRAIAATHVGTAPSLNYFMRISSGMNELAIPFNAAVVDYAIEKRIPSVMLAARWNLYLQDDATGLTDGLVATVKVLRENGVRVYFMKTVPYFHSDVPRHLAINSWWAWGNENIRIGAFDYAHVSADQKLLAETLKRYGAEVIDPGTVLFRDGDWVPFDSEGSLYFDSHHFNQRGAMLLLELFKASFGASDTPAGES